jgi:hypothetical protein
MNKPTLAQIKKAMEGCGYRIYDGTDRDGAKKNYDVNLFGVRSANRVADQFDDWVGMFWQNWETGKEEYYVWQATTDPGLPVLKDFSRYSKIGAAVLVPGQYPASHRIGLHQGLYTALVQNSPMKVYRDGNHDSIIDMFPKTIETGTFWINIHRVESYAPTRTVNIASAGCQVILNPKDFNVLMEVCALASAQWGPFFTYTLLTESQLG